MIQPEVNIRDLKTKYVIFKRIKKMNWYYRGRSTCTAKASGASFFDKEQAISKLIELNKNRKAYKFKMELAEKHLVNNWRISFSNWNDKLVISNNPMSFNDLATYRKNANLSLNKLKQDVIDSISRQKENVIRDLKIRELQYDQDIKNYINEKQTALNNMRLRIETLKSATDYIHNTDLDTEYVEKYTTETDKKAYILFGNKDQTKE